MEERLGVRLDEPDHRSVALTEAGELLLRRVGPAMLDVGDALDQVRGCSTCRRDACAQRPTTGGRSGAGADGRAVP